MKRHLLLHRASIKRDEAHNKLITFKAATLSTFHVVLINHEFLRFYVS